MIQIFRLLTITAYLASLGDVMRILVVKIEQFCDVAAVIFVMLLPLLGVLAIALWGILHLS